MTAFYAASGGEYNPKKDSNSGGSLEALTNYYSSGSGRRRSGLYKFDVSSIDTTVTVDFNSAEFTVHVTGYTPYTSGYVQGWKFHRMLVPWSQKDTYNSLNGLRSGIEYDAVEFATYLHQVADGKGAKTISGFETAVENWADGTWVNYGFVVISYEPVGYSDYAEEVVVRSKEFNYYQNQNPILTVITEADAVCTDGEARLAEDLNRDCVIDMRDFGILADDWLKSTLP